MLINPKRFAATISCEGSDCHFLSRLPLLPNNPLGISAIISFVASDRFSLN